MSAGLELNLRDGSRFRADHLFLIPEAIEQLISQIAQKLNRPQYDLEVWGSPSAVIGNEISNALWRRREAKTDLSIIADVDRYSALGDEVGYFCPARRIFGFLDSPRLKGKGPEFDFDRAAPQRMGLFGPKPTFANLALRDEIELRARFYGGSPYYALNLLGDLVKFQLGGKTFEVDASEIAQIKKVEL